MTIGQTFSDSDRGSLGHRCPPGDIERWDGIGGRFLSPYQVKNTNTNTWQVSTASTTPSRACPQAAITETRALPTPSTFLKWNQMPSKLPHWRRIGMCDVFFLFFTSGSTAYQTKPFSLLIGCHSKSILGQASMFQMGRCKEATAMAAQTIKNPAATKTISSLRNLCGQGKGAGRE